MDTSLYDEMGGEAGIRALVDRFYDLMDTLPEAARIRAMHPPDLASSREKLSLFLMMWSGGPRTYYELRGHPRMRARHLPFPIDAADRDAWLLCMNRALDESPVEPRVRAGLSDAFARIAEHMRNR